jgi:signal transduction histidine kinase/ActR/RegA family two-component response regulator
VRPENVRAHHANGQAAPAPIRSAQQLPKQADALIAGLCLGAAVVVTAMGVLVLTGWIFMIETLKRLNPSFVAMNPTTAIAFVVVGAALLLLRSEQAPDSSRRRIGRFMAAAVVLVGTLKLFALFLGWDIGIDHWFFSNELFSPGTSVPNRMAPNTALNLLLGGAALLSLDVETRGRHRPAELLSVISGATGLLAVIGYIYQAPMFYGVGSFTPMALHTAIAFIVLAIGTLLARPSGGIMAIVTSDTAGGMVARRLLPLAIVLPIALGAMRLQGQATGLYDIEFGTALYSTALVLLLLILIWWMARILFHVDTERKYIERWQNEKLERTVEDRTRRLQDALKQLKETQRQILQQERLHALGTMASGVTHDFNNALSVIIGFGEMALHECEKKPEGAELEQYLRPIVVAALDGAKVVTRLREFYRPGRNEPRAAVNVNALIEQAITITQPKWKTQALGHGLKIDIQTELGEVPPVAGDVAELREALTNLIFNAVDAMPQGGTITLRTHAENDHVTMEIGDTGTGMSEQVRRRCLDPFFTTKGERGTGLGLAMVYGIVERHRGSLDIRSAEGRGTTFIISLPKRTAIDQVTQNGAVEMAGPLRVLIADDQPLLCEILADYLKNDCHSVVAANDGYEALERFDPNEFDVVITDQAMPKMTGDQLACAIKERSPATPVILLTGFGEANGKGAQAIDHVLSKPVSLIDLRHALVRVTTNGAPAAQISANC